MKQTLTLEISLTKRSVINKLERASLTFQHFKNLLYLCIREYFKHTKDLKPFLSISFLEKFVKGKANLPFENEKIKKRKKELKKLWEEEIGSDTVKALVKQITYEIKAVKGKWQSGLKSTLPKPRKLKNTHKFTLTTNPNMLVDKRNLKKGKENAIVVRLGKNFGAVKIKLPKGFNVKIRDVKLTWFRNSEVVARISYEIEVGYFKPNPEYWLSLDLGVVNLIAGISNKEDLPSIIVNGNGIKAFNQWVNKLSAKLKSKGKSVNPSFAAGCYCEEDLDRKLWRYRAKRIKGFFHWVSNLIVSVCLKHNVGKIILPKGLEEEYQRESQKSANFNQEFRFLPLGKLKEMIKYKAKLFGIEVLEEPEPYTSKVSSISGNIEVLSGKSKEEITKEDLKKLRFEGKRVKRGLFLALIPPLVVGASVRDLKLRKVFNADLNGALNLAIKKLGEKEREGFLKLRNWLDKLARAVKVSPESPLMGIGGSCSYPLKGGSEGHLVSRRYYL
ncbi:MAG: transposase [Aquificota bacterium]|jgi:IS605 OrfB family transposase